MANDGQIVFEVTADGKHAIADIKEITRAIQQETKKWDDAAEDSTKNISDSFNGMLKKLVAGFSAVKIGKALLDIGKDAVQAASALEEVQNVVDVTFGSDANKIDKWAKDAGAQFGLTETQAKKFTSTLGAMMKSAGMSGSEITDMSTDLAGLAADMASFYNLDFETAFQKIRSGISGETEPLKQLGINMSVANLEAYALSKGITKAFNDMSQGEQTMLRYQYLMQATADAQGDFARTSDGYANSLRQMETNIESLKTKLGSVLIPAVTEAVGFLNGFLESIAPTEQKTVLDDFAEIDLKTEEKLEAIRNTAQEARALTDELDAINRSKVDQAGANVNKLAQDLAGIKLDQGKAGVVKDFIGTLADNIDVLAGLQGTDAEGASEWLTKIGKAADSLDPNDAAGWESLINTIKEGLPGLENTDFGAQFFAALGGGFADLEGKTSVLDWAIDTLGSKTNRTAEEQAYWLEICKQLVKTIPGLNSIINTETGEIKGGTQAVRDYIKAWEEGQTKLVLLGALEEKESALSSRFSDLPGLQLDMALAQRKLKQQREKLQKMADDMGITVDFSRLMKVGGNQPNMWTAAQKEFNAAVDEYYKLNKASIDATDAYNKQKDALEEAKQALKEYRETIDEMPGTIDGANAAELEWTETVKENAQTVVTAAQESLQAMTDYAQGVRDSMAKAIDSVAKGLDKVDYKKFDTINQKISDLTAQMENLEVGSDAWKELEKDLQKYNDELTSTNKIYSNLESQKQFLDDYLANLEKAQKMGLSSELIASLSDGSVESAQYLDALVNDTTGKTAKEIDTLFQEVQGKKAQLTDALTGQQLAVDETYQSMAESAKAAVEALAQLPGAAGENAGDIVKSIADALNANLPGVEQAVSAILGELEKLSGYGINIDLGGFGTFSLTVPQHESGLNFVPFDGYLASLHEGEGILTAEENRIWQKFKDGGNTAFDYDTMGGVMRDNIKPGGDVYLDGRIVGNVISEQQGRSYRQLQRSGWQG